MREKILNIGIIILGILGGLTLCFFPYELGKIETTLYVFTITLFCVKLYDYYYTLLKENYYSTTNFFKMIYRGLLHENRL
jgi:hypothetical protein